MGYCTRFDKINWQKLFDALDYIGSVCRGSSEFCEHCPLATNIISEDVHAMPCLLQRKRPAYWEEYEDYIKQNAEFVRNRTNVIHARNVMEGIQEECEYGRKV